jgi:hypothetical protein
MMRLYRQTPSLSLPRFAGEGTLTISNANLLPLPRSGGGVGRGK